MRMARFKSAANRLLGHSSLDCSIEGGRLRQADLWGGLPFLVRDAAEVKAYSEKNKSMQR